jgi:alpha-L-rhamnosidase
MLENPLGIDVTQPRLSWQINSLERNVQQQAYEIWVASSIAKLNAGEADLWHTGKVQANQSLMITYAGKPLQSGTHAYWKIKTYTNKGDAISNIAWFSMGLLNSQDWKAQWIGYDKASAWDSITQWSRLSARYFRKEFAAHKAVKQATVYVVGLGLHELYINGIKMTDHVLAPAPTDYRKTVLCNTYDVTDYIKAGNNAIATILSNGRFFTMRQNYKPKKINTFGYPKMLLQMEIQFADGTQQTIVSDETWKLNVDGPVRTANEYDGEEYDATKEWKGWAMPGFKDSHWLQPELVAAPEGEIRSQMSPYMKVMKTIKPIALHKVGNKYILDMGQNFAGWLQLKVQGKRGHTVQLRFAESLQPNGELYVANLRDAKVTDKYTLKGDGVETWHPSFVYHGFRYVEVSNYPGVPTLNHFEGHLVYDNLATTGSFETSDSTINQVYRNAWWGIASNYKGMPVDCPQRNERQPWLGDRATGAYGESFLFNNAALYAKWLNDIEASQTPEGAIPDVAPAYWNYYSDNVTWPGVYLLVADMLYQQYGDQAAVVKHYPSMKKWMQYMQSRFMKGYIMTKDKYGDWCVPPEDLKLIRSKDSLRNTDGQLIATAYYYHLLQLMQKFARLSGNQADEAGYTTLMQNMYTAFNQKFWNADKAYYANNTVTANLLPLCFDLVPNANKPSVVKSIEQKITVENKSHISTGLIGTQFLMRGLSANGNANLAYTLAANKTYPSWGYMVANGATTIWELWNGNTANPQMNSQNHVMLLGDLLIWYYENLAGIRSDTNQVAFKKIILKPESIDKLSYVKASYHSVHGLIQSAWNKRGKQFNWSITVPANTTAWVYIPAAKEKIVEGGKAIQLVTNVRYIKQEDGYSVFEIGSGSYTFTVN